MLAAALALAAGASAPLRGAMTLRPRPHVVLALPLFLLTAACGAKAQEVSCAQVAAHAVELSSPHQREDPDEMRKAIESRCVADGWSAQGRECLAEASDRAAYSACARQEKVRAGKDMGGPDCDVVVDKLEALSRPTGATYREDQHRFCQTMERSFKECVMALDDGLDELGFAEGYGQCVREQQPAADPSDAP